MLTYVIDAYNVLHSVPGLRGKLKKDFTGARDVLVMKIAGFAARGKNHMILVLDGGGEGIPSPAGQMKIVYADPGKSADQKIKQLIDRSGNPRNCVVVSSDAEVVRYGRLNSCRILDASEFVRMLEKEGKTTETEKPAGETEKEKEEWLRLFTGTK